MIHILNDKSTNQLPVLTCSNISRYLLTFEFNKTLKHLKKFNATPIKLLLE